MHFSTCSNSSVQSPSSTGDFSMRCRVLRPFPQVTLQSLHSDQGVSMQGMVSAHNTPQHLSLCRLEPRASASLGAFLQVRCVGGARTVPGPHLRCDLRHSGIMHFSTSSTSAPQIDPSAGGVFTKRSLLFMPRPQVALQTSHSPHSVTRQLLGAEPAEQSQDSVIVHLCSHLLHSDAGAKQQNSQHSSLTTQASVSSVGSVQMEPSSGNCFT